MGILNQLPHAFGELGASGSIDHSMIAGIGEVDDVSGLESLEGLVPLGSLVRLANGADTSLRSEDCGDEILSSEVSNT